MADELTGEERLRKEVSGLPVDEILALCYSFSHKPERLRLYLDVLRRQGGQRAQFAACLICFDLARQGDESLQSEFVFLAGTIRDLSTQTTFVDELLSDDPYLTFIWELLDAQLMEMDARFDTEHTVQTTHPTADAIAALDLLSDEDFDVDIAELDIDEPALRHVFDQAIERFLGKVPDIPAYDPSAGFRVGHRGDTDRVERFLLELDSLREPVAMARGFRALTLLYYGAHMRSKNLFGTVNARKQALLREGLDEFCRSGEEMWRIAGVIDMHSDFGSWDKIAEVLVDYAHWCARCGPQVQPIGEYEAVERQIERDRKRGGRRRGGRRPR